jgi:uncharacterized protein
MPRPIRPARNWKNANFLGHHPASVTAKHRPVDVDAHANFARTVAAIAPEKR